MTSRILICCLFATIVACQNEAPIEHRAGTPRLVQRFEFEIDPAARTVTVSPVSGQTARGLHVVAPLHQDGIANSGPSGTYELVTTAVRIEGEADCPMGQNCFDVWCNSFDTDTASSLYIQIDQTIPATGHDLANSDPVPGGSGLSGTFGVRSFGDIAPGGSAMRELRFYAATTVPYRVYGSLWEFGDAAFGTGADGDLVVAGAVDISSYNSPGHSCANGGDAVDYPVAGLTANQVTLSFAPAAGCLNTGDEVLLLSLRGIPGATVNVGNYETFRVASVAGDVVTLGHDKTLYYGWAAGSDARIGNLASDQKVILQRVPNYESVVVQPGGQLSAGSYSGFTGGILFFRSRTSLVVDGTLYSSGAGYHAGLVGVTSTEPPQTTEGRLALNGGGGGGGSGGHNGTNSCGIGGTGADGAEDGYCEPACGLTNPCTVQGCGGAASDSGAGGGAGYGWENAPGGAAPGIGGMGGIKNVNRGISGVGGVSSAGPGGGGGGGGAGRDSGGGGGGGTPYDSHGNAAPANLAQLHYGGGAAAGAGGGGGGGQGDYQCAVGGSGGSRNGTGGARGSDTCANNATAGTNGASGGRGGGIIAVWAATIQINGGVLAQGEAGGIGGDGGQGSQNSCTTGRAGAGGGGGGGAAGAAGGSVRLSGRTVSLGTNLVLANGGAGGAGGLSGLSNAGAGGGDSGNGGAGAAGAQGADGVVAVFYEMSLTGVAQPVAFTQQVTF